MTNFYGLLTQALYGQYRVWDHRGMSTSQIATAEIADTCDICGEDITEGEAFRPADDAGPAEHTACTADWFRRNFGREAL